MLIYSNNHILHYIYSFYTPPPPLDPSPDGIVMFPGFGKLLIGGTVFLIGFTVGIGNLPVLGGTNLFGKIFGGRVSGLGFVISGSLLPSSGTSLFFISLSGVSSILTSSFIGVLTGGGVSSGLWSGLSLFISGFGAILSITGVFSIEDGGFFCSELGKEKCPANS